MHIFPISYKSNVKVDLDTHLRDKHAHMFLQDLELFQLLVKVGQTKFFLTKMDSFFNYYYRFLNNYTWQEKTMSIYPITTDRKTSKNPSNSKQRLSREHFQMNLRYWLK